MGTNTQPTYTNCANCGTVDHTGYACPCGCHVSEMTEIEQLLQEALTALAQAPGLTSWEKAQLCDRLEDAAARAAVAFRKDDEAESDAAWSRLCAKNGWAA